MRIIGKTKDYYDYACTKGDGLIFERPVLDAAIRKRSDFIDFLKAGHDFKNDPPTKLLFILTVGYSHYLCSYSMLDDAFVFEHEYWDDKFYKICTKYDLSEYMPLAIMKVEFKRRYEIIPTGVIKDDLRPFYEWRYDFKGMTREQMFKKGNMIKLPILKAIGISGLVSAGKIVYNLESWLYSLEPKMIEPTMSEAAKLSSKGFDSSSFRGKFTGRKFKKGVK